MIKTSFGSKMVPHSYFYDKYLHSYEFYCNSMNGRRVKVWCHKMTASSILMCNKGQLFGSASRSVSKT